MPDQTILQAKLTPVAYFPKQYFLENLAIRGDNSVLVTVANQSDDQRDRTVSSEISPVRPSAADTLTKQPVAMITGGASGIGLALAQLLAKRGLRVVLADMDDARLQQATTGFAAGALIETVRLDVTDAAAVEATITQAAARHGSLD